MKSGADMINMNGTFYRCFYSRAVFITALMMSSSSYAVEESVMGYSADVSQLEKLQSEFSHNSYSGDIAYMGMDGAELGEAQAMQKNEMLSTSLLNEVTEAQLANDAIEVELFNESSNNDSR